MTTASVAVAHRAPAAMCVDKHYTSLHSTGGPLVECNSKNIVMATPLDTFDIMIPEGMRSYLRAYGYNFNRKACEFAVKKMKRLNPATGKKEPIEAMGKEAVEELLQKHNIKLEHNEGHNFVYAANMIKADFWKSSIKDDASMALMIKDIIEDPDMPGGNLFRRWLADADASGMVIDWDDIL